MREIASGRTRIDSLNQSSLRSSWVMVSSSGPSVGTRVTGHRSVLLELLGRLDPSSADKFFVLNPLDLSFLTQRPSLYSIHQDFSGSCQRSGVQFSAAPPMLASGALFRGALRGCCCPRLPANMCRL